ncbi:MAG: DUF1249 domain-containing protein [Pseudomonadota bacterium]|nr:MAG: DUF1249 domain-containing protein [Pseudomonadota bacterium]
MWVYERNYVALMDLFEGLRRDSGTLASAKLQLEMQVIERSRYTTEISLHHSFHNRIPAVPDQSMRVRVYHDAQLAEVVSYQGVDRLLPEYVYPNDEMLHRDEKRQANMLLHEWLSLFKARRKDPERTSNLSNA